LISRVTPVGWRACHKPTFSRRRKLHAPPFDPVRRRARSLLALPDTQDELIRHYTFSEPDLSLIRQRRGDANRLGVAVQLCLLRFPGQGLLPDASVPMPLLQWIGRQLRIDPSCWPQYAEREETRREHLLELRAYLGMEPFGLAHYRQAVHATTELALQTDKGIVLAAVSSTRCATGTSSCRRWMSSSASARSDHPRQPAHLRCLGRTAVGRTSPPP
jgi:hypothetical protein